MEFKDLFEQFNTEGKLRLPNGTVSFAEIPWMKHAAFEGVELKYIVTSTQTNLNSDKTKFLAFNNCYILSS